MIKTSSRMRAYSLIRASLKPGDSVLEFAAHGGIGRTLLGLRPRNYVGVSPFLPKHSDPVANIQIADFINNDLGLSSDVVIYVRANMYPMSKALWRIYESVTDTGQAWVGPIEVADLPLLYKYFTYVTIYVYMNMKLALCEKPKPLEDVVK